MMKTRINDVVENGVSMIYNMATTVEKGYMLGKFIEQLFGICVVCDGTAGYGGEMTGLLQVGHDVIGFSPYTHGFLSNLIPRMYRIGKCTLKPKLFNLEHVEEDVDVLLLDLPWETFGPYRDHDKIDLFMEYDHMMNNLNGIIQKSVEVKPLKAIFAKVPRNFDFGSIDVPGYTMKYMMWFRTHYTFCLVRDDIQLPPCDELNVPYAEEVIPLDEVDYDIEAQPPKKYHNPLYNKFMKQYKK